MKRLPIAIVLTAGLIFSSCSKKSPEFVNSIPDDAIGVVSLHPMQLHTKSQINSIESIKERVKDEIWEQIIDNPLSTGLMLDEYTYIFVKMEENAPIIGVVSGMKDVEKFIATLKKIKDGIMDTAKEMEGYKYIQADEEGVIAWNEKQMIVLTSPDNDEFEESYWTGSLDWMFNPVKEESITSLVDFKDFQGKMKDLNIWLSTDEIRKVIEVLAKDKIPELPVALYNNYAQIYFDFSNGALDISGETHFSEEVEKNVEEFLVMNPSLNEEMLKLAPGGNLLVALAGSMDLKKIQNMVEKFAPPELDSVGSKVEAATGIAAKELLNAFTGDFTIAVNGIEGEAMIPVEVFLGFGVNGEAIQEKLMEKVQGMAPVEKQGDFFVINVQGNEIYSGIINNLWVITNAKGYRDAIEGGKLDNSLVDSKFSDFADGSMGMYVNLNLSSYPGMVKGLLDQKEEQSKWVGKITDPFDYLGITAGNYQSLITLKTNKPSENSLYTILRLTDTPE
jgi:phosphoribosylanthranilate isomerase